MSLPLMAQEIPGGGPAPVSAAPKMFVETGPTPQQQAAAMFQQALQIQQNFANATFNSAAIQSNPTISPLDQRSGLSQQTNQNATNNQGVTGLGISSNAVQSPTISNSNLMNKGDTVDPQLLALLQKLCPGVNPADLNKMLFDVQTAARYGHPNAAQIMRDFATMLERSMDPGLSSTQKQEITKQVINALATGTSTSTSGSSPAELQNTILAMQTAMQNLQSGNKPTGGATTTTKPVGTGSASTANNTALNGAVNAISNAANTTFGIGSGSSASSAASANANSSSTTKPVGSTSTNLSASANTSASPSGIMSTANQAISMMSSFVSGQSASAGKLQPTASTKPTSSTPTTSVASTGGAQSAISQSGSNPFQNVASVANNSVAGSKPTTATSTTTTTSTVISPTNIQTVLPSNAFSAAGAMSNAMSSVFSSISKTMSSFFKGF